MNAARHSSLTRLLLWWRRSLPWGPALEIRFVVPNYQNVDLALIKRTYIRERMNVEFRAEAFNLTNTPPLNAPNVVLGTPGFGSITSAGDPRVLQFALKFNF